MERAREPFLELSDISLELLRSPEIRDKWEEPSALPKWSIAGLSGHLVRCTVGVEIYLDADPAPAGEALGPAAYYVSALDDDGDVDNTMNVGIRARGDEMAAQGYEALLKQLEEVTARLRERLAMEPPERNVRVWKDIVMLLDDYLATRVLELTCHIDDVAVSVGLPTPQPPLAATDITIRLLTAIARHRHGDLEVLRSLARRERLQGPLRIL